MFRGNLTTRGSSQSTTFYSLVFASTKVTIGFTFAWEGRFLVSILWGSWMVHPLIVCPWASLLVFRTTFSSCRNLYDEQFRPKIHLKPVSLFVLRLEKKKKKFISIPETTTFTTYSYQILYDLLSVSDLLLFLSLD